jgi:hypothetical protein
MVDNHAATNATTTNMTGSRPWKHHHVSDAARCRSKRQPWALAN